jgi:peptidoglycan/LPS O-acetylase OafA/YrhL
MKSTEGLYFSRLDHVRAFAAFLVFSWHFLHVTPVFPVPYEAVPPFPLALLEEGHTGVSLFMTLSGYLFAKLIGDKQLNYPAFLWSRAVRLFPLLLVCLVAWMIIFYLKGTPIGLGRILRGFIWPTWPGGAWSITVELHFYLIFPVIIFLVRRAGPGILLAAIVGSLAVRTGYWMWKGHVQLHAYSTILGHIDQFLLGMFFARVRVESPRVRAAFALAAATLFLTFWHFFNVWGGHWRFGGYPSTTPLWIVIPTIEGITYVAFIVWYENARIELPAALDRWLCKIGEWSYSIYLLHFFPRELLRYLFAEEVGSGAYFWPAMVVVIAGFIAFLPIPAASYEYFEKPMMRFRRRYLGDAKRSAPAA